MRREQRRFSLLPRDLSGGIVVFPANHRLSASPELHRLRLLSRIRTSSPFLSAGSRLTCVAGELASASLGRAFFGQRRRLPLAPSSSLFLSRLNSPMAARRLQAHSLRRALSLRRVLSGRQRRHRPSLHLHLAAPTPAAALLCCPGSVFAQPGLSELVAARPSPGSSAQLKLSPLPPPLTPFSSYGSSLFLEKKFSIGVLCGLWYMEAFLELVEGSKKNRD
ncbi:uncharacterized protein LOC125188448 [Salvia hispanica]|uniref:uncharacterized protein LOC125188448 n=1 Tax=Salvia hispanica TaxID=49212 RepID=UPI00200910D9|nr:uncharacterized protein LOC125188448 [Salvia hispanica]